VPAQQFGLRQAWGAICAGETATGPDPALSRTKHGADLKPW
jgi:hypothetical protein